MSRFWSEHVHRLQPYVPGEQPKLRNLIKLNTNESPFAPSPKALVAMREACGEEMRLYPDPNSQQLAAAIAKRFDLAENQVFVGNGSDEVLAHVFNALFGHGREVLFPDISYSFYPVYCGLYGLTYRTVALDQELRINVDDYQGPNGGIIFPNPNAPTGVLLDLEAIERLLQSQSESVVVVDEAYIDFGGHSAAALIDRYPNLLVVQTLSKSRALAGLRVGFALGQAHLIEGLERVKNSFNSYPLSRVAQAGALASIQDETYLRKTVAQLCRNREQLSDGLQARGFEVLPSAANFVFARHMQHDAEQLARGLREQAVIVRHFKQPRIQQFLRITVGTEQQHSALFGALDTLLS